MVRAILPALLLWCAPGMAVDRLRPTALPTTGDCLSPRIVAPVNAAQARSGRARCLERNRGEPDKIQGCLTSAPEQVEVAFFWDTCGSSDGPFEISLGGTVYTLEKVKRLDDRKVPVAGVYRAAGLRVVIEPGRLLKRSRVPDSDIVEGEYEVFVIAKQGSTVNRIRAVYLPGGP